MSTVINIKTDPQVKKQAQKIVAELGISLSGAINGFLRQLIRNKSVFLSLNEDVPSEYLLSMIKDSEKEWKRGNYHSFKSNKEALEFLKNN